MRKTAIVSDSTCDLTKELIERYQIHIIPLHVLLGDQEYRDGEDITVEEIYTWANANKTTPKTSAVSVEDSCTVLKKALAEAEEVVCFALGEKISASAKMMRLAVEELGAQDRVFVIDSRNLSTGIAQLVIEGCLLADQGKSGAEIVAEIEKLRPLVRSSFTVDTLRYLYRGGRCSGLSMVAGTALKLHPKISVVDGVLYPGKKYRGRINKAIEAYVDDLLPELADARPARVFITHSCCDEEIINKVKKKLEDLHHFDEILITVTGSVISCHCGPGTLGVLFIANQ